MDRATRHQIKHDRFVDDVGSAYSYVQTHRRTALWATVAGIALIALIVGFVVVQRGEESRAQQRLAEAISILDGPLESQAAPETPGPKYKSEEEKLNKARPIFEEVVAKHSRTDAADIASLYLARLAAEKGDVATARPKLEEFVREHPDHLLAAAAQRSIFEIRLSGGEGPQVIADLEKELAAEEKSLMPDDVILAMLADAYEQTGNPAKAREAYQRIVNEFPDSPYTIDAQRKLFQS